MLVPCGAQRFHSPECFFSALTRSPRHATDDVNGDQNDLPALSKGKLKDFFYIRNLYGNIEDVFNRPVYSSPEVGFYASTAAVAAAATRRTQSARALALVPKTLDPKQPQTLQKRTSEEHP